MVTPLKLTFLTLVNIFTSCGSLNSFFLVLHIVILILILFVFCKSLTSKGSHKFSTLVNRPKQFVTLHNLKVTYCPFSSVFTDLGLWMYFFSCIQPILQLIFILFVLADKYSGKMRSSHNLKIQTSGSQPLGCSPHRVTYLHYGS